MELLLLPAAAVFVDIPPALIGPFGLLLILIAVMPLTPPRAKHLWERYYPHAAIGLGLLVAAFYLTTLAGGGAVLVRTLHEYFSFISLIGSLFVVAGGIHLGVRGEATPRDNVVFLAIGAMVANVIGTTGASMVLIRPWIRMNKIRISAYHIVFFIFIVSNCGGALTPIGDPPLFLGYLRGVPFFWLIEHVIWDWLVTIGAILAVFYILDRRSFKHAPRAIQEQIKAHETFRFEGGVNLLFLLAIIGAVFLPETFFLRELVMLGAAAASYRLTPKVVHEENHFTFGPIKEVAFLFIGIFLTMMPALGYLDRHGKEFGFNQPDQYYFASGSLSSVLDNAPTYLNFLQLAEATFVDKATLAPNAEREVEARAGVRQMLASEHLRRFIIAVSLGSVFFGAMTYIGNGPNFMVKSIAESAGVKVPTFFGYVFKYSLPFLLPILALGGWLFL
ncbi:MAG TPA: sodium:proton antiporter [Opitutaceae bacterium]|nr:sodium:proton antiporter [Opitutaceae bacterium]